MPNLRGTEWLIIILLVVLLFGAKRLPDAARSVGRSLRIFKAETKGLVEGEVQKSEDSSASQSQQAGELPAPATPVEQPPQAQAQSPQPQAQAQAQPPQAQSQPPQQA